MANLNLKHSQRKDKAQVEDFVQNSIEHQNPHLKKQGKYTFPPLTAEEKERLANCDMYGNPIKRTDS